MSNDTFSIKLNMVLFNDFLPTCLGYAGERSSDGSEKKALIGHPFFISLGQKYFSSQWIITTRPRLSYILRSAELLANFVYAPTQRIALIVLGNSSYHLRQTCTESCHRKAP